MPIDSGGSYRMTQGGANMHSAAAVPADQTQTAAPQSITLTKQPDGSWQCDDGNGDAPSTHPTLDDALAYVKSTEGGDPTASQSQSSAGSGSAATDNGDDSY